MRLEAPFHTIRDINDGYSFTIFNGHVVDSVSLMTRAAPARYADRVGAVLAVRTREGPIRAKISWIASARKSYLDYIIEGVDDDPRLALGYHDVTARLTWRPRPSQAVALLALAGRSRYENTEPDPPPHAMESAAAGGGLRFDSDFDQRHTVTAYLRARAGKSVLLSTAFRYGSGFPFPGFLRETPDGVFVATERNRFGPSPYSRWDVRGERRFTRGRVTLDLFLEVANLLGHENERYNEIDSVDPVTGRVRLDRGTMLPLIPLFGATVEF